MNLLHPNGDDMFDRPFDYADLAPKQDQEICILEGRKVGRYKKYHDVTVSPFEYYFFQDKNAKHGVLFRVKDILKSRYGAQFHSADRGVFEGAWWRIPTRYDLVEIFNVMQ